MTPTIPADRYCTYSPLQRAELGEAKSAPAKLELTSGLKIATDSLFKSLTFTVNLNSVKYEKDQFADYLNPFPVLISHLLNTEKEIKAEIKHVTVYPDRAQLNHETSVEIPAGKTILKLSGLSPYIDAQSIQVKGFGDFTILSVNHQNNYLQNLEDSPEIKKYQEPD